MCSFTLSPDLLCLSFPPSSPLFFPVFHPDPRNAAAGENETGEGCTYIRTYTVYVPGGGVRGALYYTNFFLSPSYSPTSVFPILPSSYRSPPPYLRSSGMRMNNAAVASPPPPLPSFSVAK